MAALRMIPTSHTASRALSRAARPQRAQRLQGHQNPGNLLGPTRGSSAPGGPGWDPAPRDAAGVGGGPHGEDPGPARSGCAATVRCCRRRLAELLKPIWRCDLRDLAKLSDQDSVPSFMAPDFPIVPARRPGVAGSLVLG